MATPDKKDIELYDGDSFALTMTVVDPGGTPIDLTGVAAPATPKPLRSPLSPSTRTAKRLASSFSVWSQQKQIVCLPRHTGMYQGPTQTERSPQA